MRRSRASSRGSPLCSASSSSSAILRSPSTPRRVVGRQRLDQAADPVADLQREVGGGGAGEGADVLGGDLVAPAEQLGVLGLAHSSPPILASSASSSTSACWFTSIASWSPITQTWL